MNVQQRTSSGPGYQGGSYAGNQNSFGLNQGYSNNVSHQQPWPPTNNNLNMANSNMTMENSNINRVQNSNMINMMPNNTSNNYQNLPDNIANFSSHTAPSGQINQLYQNSAYNPSLPRQQYPGSSGPVPGHFQGKHPPAHCTLNPAQTFQQPFNGQPNQGYGNGNQMVGHGQANQMSGQANQMSGQANQMSGKANQQSHSVVSTVHSA